jgi:hypothetical protein
MRKRGRSAAFRKPIAPAAQVARLGEDDVFQLLHGGGLHRRFDPVAVGQHLAAGGHAQRIGAQILIEDRDGHLHPLVRVGGVGVPVGHDHAAGAVGLGSGMNDSARGWRARGRN